MLETHTSVYNNCIIAQNVKMWYLFLRFLCFLYKCSFLMANYDCESEVSSMKNEQNNSAPNAREKQKKNQQPDAKMKKDPAQKKQNGETGL